MRSISGVQELARRFTARLSRRPELQLPAAPAHMHHAWHLYIVGLGPESRASRARSSSSA